MKPWQGKFRQATWAKKEWQRPNEIATMAEKDKCMSLNFPTASWTLDKTQTRDILKFWQATWDPPWQVLLVHTEELCSRSIPLKWNPRAKSLMCIGLKSFSTTTLISPFKPPNKNMALTWYKRHLRTTEKKGQKNEKLLFLLFSLISNHFVPYCFQQTVSFYTKYCTCKNQNFWN